MVSVDEFALQRDVRGFELVDGEVRERSSTLACSQVTLRLMRALAAFAEEQNRGVVFGPDTGLACFEGRQTVLKPSGMFFAAGRLTPEMKRGAFAPIVPDLVVEVVGPLERATHHDQRLLSYLTAGVRLLWTIDPQNSMAYIYRSDDPSRCWRIRRDGILDGSDVLPGFRFQLADVLSDPSPSISAE